MTPATALASPKILVIEDYTDTRELLSVLLHQQGYQVLQARSGPEGLLTACGALPDLVIMDLALPEMDGIEVARRIRETAGLSDVPIFIVSAYLTPAVQDEIRAAGCAEMFAKPCDFDSLLETIRITLGER